MASSNRPSFISAIPNACQPSKNWESISVQRRYFSTALSSSPIARSPLASSKMSSRDSMCSVADAVSVRWEANSFPTIGASQKSGGLAWFCLLALQDPRFPLLFPQPFEERNFAFVGADTIAQFLLLRAVLCFIRRLSFFQRGDNATIFPWEKLTDIARLQCSHGILHRDQIRWFLLVLRFIAFGIVLVYQGKRRQLLRLHVHLFSSERQWFAGLQPLTEIVDRL